jgi:hypothetical protein
MHAKYPDHQDGTSFYLEAKGEPAGNVDFGTHFNPRLAQQSAYFKSLAAVMKCAERNANSEDPAVCAKEFKQLRLSAFKEELLYHNVNKRHFMNEIMSKKNESPY